jgi:hypothetical protein
MLVAGGLGATPTHGGMSIARGRQGASGDDGGHPGRGLVPGGPGHSILRFSNKLRPVSLGIGRFGRGTQVERSELRSQEDGSETYPARTRTPEATWNGIRVSGRGNDQEPGAGFMGSSTPGYCCTQANSRYSIAYRSLVVKTWDS